MVRQDVLERALSVVGQGYAQYEYFFDRLDSPDWVQPLLDRGFFREPPGIERRGDMEFWSGWPESHYLARVADKGPDVVAKAFCAMPDSDNPFLLRDLLDAALNMPGPIAKALAKKLRAWIEAHEFVGSLVDHRCGKLIAHLAREGETEEAISFARALLDVLPDARYVESPEPRTKIHTWYREVLEKDIPALVDAAGLQALGLLCDLLEKAIRLSSLKSDEGKPQDHSHWWLAGVDKSERFPLSQIRRPLAIAVRDAAVQVARRDAEKLPTCVHDLDARQWHVFRRIALFVLAQFPGEARQLVVERLIDKQLFHDYPLEHEYFTLAGARLGELSSEQQATFLGWIDEGPPPDDRDNSPGDPARDRYSKRWRCQRFHYVREHLTGHHRQTYESLSAELGEYGTRSLEAIASDTTWVGPTSPLSDQDVTGMSDEELLAFLRGWKPSKEWTSPSPEGLSRLLSALAEEDPARLAGLAPRLIGFEPTYVRGLFHGLEEAVRSKRTFPWQPPLELAGWVVSEHGTEVDAERIPDGRDPGWGWTRKAIASLLSYGFREEATEIPFDCRRDVWDILQVLCEDPEPTPEYEATYGGTNMHPADLSLNVVRGQAMHAAVGYAVWVRRHLQEQDELVDGDKNWIESMPEVKALLERHLDPAVDPAHAVRSVYGQCFSQLVWLDREWAASLAGAVFGGLTSRDELQRTAWNTYIAFSPAYTDVLAILEEVYALAVSELGTGTSDDNDRWPPEPPLAEHLMAFYTWGAMESTKRRAILFDFFQKAPDSLRAHAIGTAGEWAQGIHGEGEEEKLTRLKDLWLKRLKTARDAAAKGDFTSELSAFGSWFVSGRFPEDWAIGQLTEVLQLTGKARSDLEVVQRLSRVADEYLAQALCCIEAMVKGDDEGWAILGWKKEAESLLRRCRHSTDRQLKDNATEFVNWLGARGHRDFRKLLAEDEAQTQE